jgi:hypothetical protein
MFLQITSSLHSTHTKLSKYLKQVFDNSAQILPSMNVMLNVWRKDLRIFGEKPSQYFQPLSLILHKWDSYCLMEHLILCLILWRSALWLQWIGCYIIIAVCLCYILLIIRKHFAHRNSSFSKLPHSALSWNLSLAGSLANLSLHLQYSEMLLLLLTLSNQTHLC